MLAINFILWPDYALFNTPFDIMKIKRTKNGYTTVIYVGQDNGKSVAKRYTAPTKDELTKKVLEIQRAQEIERTSMAFVEALSRYIRARDGLKSPSTIKGYKSMKRTLETDYTAFCGMNIQRMTEKDVQAVIDSMHRDGKSPKTLRNFAGLIMSTLSAEKVRLSPPILPAKENIDRPIPSVEEVKEMMALLEGDPLEIPFQLAIMGLRRSEICALEIDDLDENDDLRISKSMVTEDGGTAHIRSSTKTAASYRFVHLPKSLADKIRLQGYVTNLTLSGLSCRFAKFVRKNGFPPYRLHDCRHFYASYCHAQGIPEADILAGGGWQTSNVMRTVYRHSMAKNKASAEIACLIDGE